jgi:hypothetical protein
MLDWSAYALEAQKYLNEYKEAMESREHNRADIAIMNLTTEVKLLKSLTKGIKDDHQ